MRTPFIFHHLTYCVINFLCVSRCDSLCDSLCKGMVMGFFLAPTLIPRLTEEEGEEQPALKRGYFFISAALRYVIY